MNQATSFGGFVRQRRREMDLTQEELARRVGCAAITLRKIEADDIRASVQIAERLGMALAIPLEERAEFVRWARSVRPASSELPAVTPPPSMEEIGREDLTGRAIRGYSLSERIGMGGMGSVYRAVQPNVEREVAIKIILPAFANHPDFIRRFEAEAQLVARLEHPHIVPLYDYWREPGVAFLVMRLLRGGNIQALLAQRPLSIEMTARMLDQICAALHAAHRIGVIHRDLKPANVLLDEDSNAYLADFGIAKNLGNPNLENQTQMDAMIGSPQYMSPEQIRLLSVRPQTDIYCLGVMLYEMLTGTLPFTGPTPFDMIQQHINTPMPPLSARQPGLPAALDEVIARATAKDPEARYADALSLFKDFRQAAGRIIDTHAPTLTYEEEDSETEIDNPYKGLHAFSEADTDNFFGRETLVQQLLARLGEGGELSRFLAVIGPSGSGKSSVVRAGLIPALRRGGLPGSENWFIVDMLPGKHPFEELEASLLRVAVNPPQSLLSQLKDGARGLLRAVHRILPADESVELVLVIDQFEEIFTFVEEEAERALLLENMATAVLDERSRLRVIITLRADFTDKPLRYIDFGEMMNRRFEFVLPLTTDEVERAVVGPAQRVGLRLEKGLVSTIIREAGNQPGTLPLLQHALSELFERREGCTLTIKAYHEIGGVLGALGRRAEAIYASLDSAGQAGARQLFLRLVTLGEGTEDTRRRVLREELESLVVDRVQLSIVIEAFGHARLLSFDRDPITRGPTLEVAHEALLREWTRLREWVSESRADVRMQRQLASAASEWNGAGQESSFLLTGARLEQTEAWAENTPVALTQNERAYLDASIRERNQSEVEERARGERELENLQRLAEAEKGRAEEQTLAAKNLRTRNQVITAVSLVAVVLALLAGLFGIRSNQNAIAAQHNAATAQAAREEAVHAQATAEGERLRAENEKRLATSRELAGGAINNLDVDPERSILLAMQAVMATYAVDGTTTKEARDALHRAVLNSRLRLALYSQPGDGYGLAISPDGKQIVTSGSTGEIKFWDLASRTTLFTLSGHEGPVYYVAFSPDGSRLASASGDGTARVWDLDTRKVLHDLRGHGDEVISAAFGQDGKRLVTASFDGTAKVWDATDGELLLTFTGHSAPLLSAQFSPDGTRIATTGDDSTARVWDSTSGQELYILSDFTRVVSGATFSPDGNILATNGGDDPKLWDAATGKLLFILPGGSAASAQPPVFTPDGRYVAVAGQDGKVSMWDTVTGKQHLTFATGTPVDSQIEFSHECITSPSAPLAGCGSFLVTGNRDGSVRFWDVTPAGRREVLTLPGFWNCLAPDGKKLYTAAEANGGDLQIRTWQFADLASVLQPSNPLGLPGQEISSHPAGAGDFGTVVFAPDCSVSAVLDQTNLMTTITNTLSGKQRLQFLLAEGTPTFTPIGSYSLSPDATRLAAIGPENTAKVYDLENDGRELLTLDGHEAPLLTVSFSPDGNSISTTSQDNSAKLWDAETGQELYTFPGHTAITNRAVFSPDGTRLATSSFDRTVKIWGIETGHELFTLTGHGATVWAIAFSPDGKLIATGSNDRTFRLWDADTGEPLLTIPTAIAPTQAAFTPDSAGLVMSFINNETQVYLPRVEDLYTLARSRVSRTLTAEECQQYLHVEQCPTRP
jgi:WD40 repeat protein/serine/threonine protein kinase/DNA-binding XRE family transcriptional regulator